MTFNGFNTQDFNVFQTNGLEERMDQIINQIRPKLEALGNKYAEELTALTGEEMFYHVAKHARRTVNPPKDTWVAFAPNKRGYKMLPHFQIGLWETHVFIWFALIYESPIKDSYGKVFLKKINKIKKSIPNDFVWSDDHMKPESYTHREVKKERLEEMAIRLSTVKKAELLCGVRVEKDEAVKMSEDDWYDRINETFKTLLPLYNLKKIL
ncbi:YktB family protein [Fictibacillus barbaricus]|uniref:UPF0637 protein JYA64_11885 n=1 Tax=Fictibacillus barbaricus TaxID=182136 RepID=A0ABS2ZCS7_9BACL|nr:DUF1054 domain-containing protein [Fictibacillus barbaricus]MBN3545999.1 DUF1054 domain-containing protein [Fictibacillus barbaricus]GGB57832.1 UPF0637 protein YktB [Fictibacillus barbaricus]